MSVRHPPKNRVPPVGKRGKPRVLKYAAPDESFMRHWARRIFRPPVIVALVVLTTFTVGIFSYYYWVFSARIDRLISGEIYTRSAGIYTAPRELRVGTPLSASRSTMTNGSPLRCSSRMTREPTRPAPQMMK